MSLLQELVHLKIPLDDIKLATDNFADHNFIGQGRFGKVYKGHLPLSDSATGSSDQGTSVAVKRLDPKVGLGQHEFLIEIIMLSLYRHDNLVSLVGFSDEGGEKIIVFEHEARESLDKYLATTDLTWVRRLQICLDAANGLSYLPRGVEEGQMMLHRDVKSSNVLLDKNWKAKISNFGLSKYVTAGVLPEDYVYSFGVVLFEVLCGRPLMTGNYDDEGWFLSRLAKLHFEEGKLDEFIVPNLRKQMKPNSLRKFSAIAYQCLKEDPEQRPKTRLIVEELQIALECQLGYRTIIGIGLWGSCTGGSPWSFQLESNQKLRKITIDYEDWVYSISFTTQNLSGSLHSSPRYGGDGGSSSGEISEIIFDDDEEIIGIFGTVGITTGYYAGYTVISSLRFVTNKKTYGPFGRVTETRFSATWDIGSFAGFYGRRGFYLDGLSCYLKDTV